MTRPATAVRRVGAKGAAAWVGSVGTRFATAASMLVAVPAGKVAGQEPLSAADAGALKAGVPSVEGVQLSPDGNSVVYQITWRSVLDNALRLEQRLQRLPRDRSALEPHAPLPAGAVAIRWCPDGRCLGMILPADDPDADTRFARYDVGSGDLEWIAVRDTARVAGNSGVRPRVNQVSPRYRWSPAGTFVAFTSPLAEPALVDPTRGVPQFTEPLWTHTGLFVLEVATGTVTQVTPDSLHVARNGGFDWAPDERTLVVAIDRESDSQGKNTDLVLVDRGSGAVRTLVSRPGMDGAPQWSPDGRWIAFMTQHGEPSYWGGWPALVPAQGGAVVVLPPESTPMGAPGWWAPDGRALYYESYLGMTQVLVRADPTSQTATVLAPVTLDVHLVHETNRSMSADARRLAFTRESLTLPPDLFVANLETDGRPASPPRRITDLAPGFPLTPLVHADTLSWRGPDGRFTIHGLLLTPAAARRADGGLDGPLPTVLKFIGGPTMVRRGFAADGWNGAHLALAARGYAVLLPNTRGRGGYGVEFENAIRDERNRGRAPLADALAGVDLLVRRGIADPDRLGVIGHSYGGYLTAYAITQTHRFRAAVNHEGVHFNLFLPEYVGNPPGGWRELLNRDLYGIHDPFLDRERARLLEESPPLNAERMRTPTLHLYGSAAERHGRPFFHAQLRAGVPAAMFLYDEGHVFRRPAAIADDFTRTAEWLDYWVRDVSFPDPERAAEYGRFDGRTAVRPRP